MKIVGNTEYALVLYRDRLPKFNNNGKMIFNCMDWERDDISSPLIRKIHPTQKPVKLLERLIEIFTDEGDVIIDPVAGSGSTLIAAANKNRKAYGFEIKKDFYKQAKEWEDDILNYHKEIKEFGFAKSLINRSALSLWD
jgi:site-specific DNA-methyltransferase (adenine-specific)